MTNYYVAFSTRSQAFLLERRLKGEGIPCEIAYMPREVMTDLCNMGVKFSEIDKERALYVIRRAGIPGCRVYREIMLPHKSIYEQVNMEYPV